MNARAERIGKRCDWQERCFLSKGHGGVHHTEPVDAALAASVAEPPTDCPCKPLSEAREQEIRRIRNPKCVTAINDLLAEIERLRSARAVAEKAPAPRLSDEQVKLVCDALQKAFTDPHLKDLNGGEYVNVFSHVAAPIACKTVRAAQAAEKAAPAAPPLSEAAIRLDELTKLREAHYLGAEPDLLFHGEPRHDWADIGSNHTEDYLKERMAALAEVAQDAAPPNQPEIAEVIQAMQRHEPVGHVHDLVDLVYGAVRVAGKPPHEYLMRTDGAASPLNADELRLEEANRWFTNWNVDESIRSFAPWAEARIAELRRAAPQVREESGNKA